MKISAVIITLNEEKNLPKCLESLNWVDEIIIVDSNSFDNTVSIGRLAGAKVYEREHWTGFGDQKNKAIKYATGDWIFSIDADERATPELAHEIKEVISSGLTVSGLMMPRSSSYCGQIMRYGGWWPDYVLRCFQKGAGTFSNDLVHEKLLVNGPIRKLKNPIRHQSFDNLEQVLEKINKYSSLGAKQLASQGKQHGLAAALIHGVNAFLKTYIVKAGFLDGRRGLMLAISNAEGTYYKYVKLMLMQNNKK